MPAVALLFLTDIRCEPGTQPELAAENVEEAMDRRAKQESTPSLPSSIHGTHELFGQLVEGV